MNNKPGKSPLDPSTRTGKVISRIMEAIGNPALSFERSNLFDLDFFPHTGKLDHDVRSVQIWADRVGYKGTGDIVVTLGHCVNEVFRKAKVVPSIKVGHPSGVWSNEAKRVYITRVAQLVNHEFYERIENSIINS